jgi:flagellar motor switch/type III secretory pathway protein FliN
MSINFTKAIVNRLQREIADIESKSMNEKNKKEKAQSKINQLQRDMKLSQSPSNLSSKMTRINKLNEDIKSINRVQADLSKRLVTTKTSLKQHLAKEPQQEETYD